MIAYWSAAAVYRSYSGHLSLDSSRGSVRRKTDQKAEKSNVLPTDSCTDLHNGLYL